MAESTAPGLPLLSVILFAPFGLQVALATLYHLQRQTVRDQIELVLVSPDRHVEKVQPFLNGFHSWKIVHVPTGLSIGQANALGVRHAAAPVVVFSEDHAFPFPNWAEALIRAHQQDWAAVGPVVINANPKALTSWADFLMGYLPWMDPAERSEVPFLPGHNSSYKKKILLEFDNPLEFWLDSEILLHFEMRRRGYRLLVEPAARIRHTNFAQLWPWLISVFHSARVFASRRLHESPTWRRLVYGVGSPLIPVVRYRRILAELRRRGMLPLLIRVTPVLIVGLIISATGEMFGYLLGEGFSAAKASSIDVYRERFVSSHDKALFQIPPADSSNAGFDLVTDRLRGDL